MLDTVERTAAADGDELFSPLPASARLDTAAKRALIESELRKDGSRSDREIAEVIKAAAHGTCDHKTVGTVRRKIANSPAALFPILAAAAARDEKKKFNPFDPKPADPDDLCLIAPERLGLACFVNTRNNICICNGNMRDGIDEMVQIAATDIPALISRLREIQSEFDDGQYDHNEPQP
jgi:hypothetical protein